ncbi:hypothetical protein [Granulosicoccus antarcticus]|uniref:SnoaL-like domain-containing protein n=1 Tax=Granulosicoccus antarcticus IMCC3135 TaxID=1192854 RepID=A0A2Z2P332_9GAMM|nr:hypothetical protein [Granulosicoccus antarcticus]ASJ74154.1 hypothetical protein IMCC3135_20385 [Granulosicoccus antarcticus IMCC3135]
MTHKFALAATVALLVSCATTVAQAQELCAPDIDFKSAVGHDQAPSSLATLNSAFKSASKNDQNDLVFVYSKVTSDTGVSAVVDLFRVRDNILVEHWDVVQQVPADEEIFA